jgi:hypothetical protein
VLVNLLHEVTLAGVPCIHWYRCAQRGSTPVHSLSDLLCRSCICVPANTIKAVSSCLLETLQGQQTKEGRGVVRRRLSDVDRAQFGRVVLQFLTSTSHCAR